MPRYDVALETSWPAMYHDLMAEGLKVTRRPVGLRTQTKNATRESEAVKFSPMHPMMRAGMRVSYQGQHVLRTASKTILEVMCNVTGTEYSKADYRLPIPSSWDDTLDAALGTLPDIARRRPWLVHRPLVARTEWRGSMARNADPASYTALFDRIREKFFVVSVADLEPGKEWLVGPGTKADLSFHHGELVFEALAALFRRADLVFTSSGFAAVLGPAVGVPTISVVGGYEDPRCHDSGARFSPYLVLGPRTPCSCWTSSCTAPCNKQIEMLSATSSLDAFMSENFPHLSDR